MGRKKKLGCLAVLLLLIAARATLPWFLEGRIERSLSRADEHQVVIDDLDLELWRGAYRLEGVRVGEEDVSEADSSLSIDEVDLSIRWSGLLAGRVEAEVVLWRPHARLVRKPDTEGAATEGSPSLAERLEAILPFDLQRYVVREGKIEYVDPTRSPAIEYSISDLYLEGWALSNRPREDGAMSVLEAAGRPFDTGEFELRAAFDVLADGPRFELDAELRAIDVRTLNDAFRAYSNLDAESGTLLLSTEIAAEGGRFDGYVKILVEDLELVSFGEIDDPGDALSALWDGFVQLGAELLENDEAQRIGARVPIEGEIESLETDILRSIISLLENAFVTALHPAIDAEQSTGDLDEEQGE